MIAMILSHTPLWVWGLLAVLLRFGFIQTRSREISMGRAAVLPVVMVLLSFYGLATRFGCGPAYLGWLTGMAASVTLCRTLDWPRGATFDTLTQRFSVPGSWMPVVLILATFISRYVAIVAAIMHPELAQGAAFGVAVGLLYGGLSGLFFARGLGLWLLRTSALQPSLG